MFSGIVEEKGKIAQVIDTADGRKLKVTAPLIARDPALKAGDSISVAGICLTVTEFEGDRFAIEAVHETLRRTRLGELTAGDTVNLERALKLSDRLGGHLVSGHVDAIGAVKSIKLEGFSKLIEFETSADLAPFFVEKGSVTVDGASLTVAAIKLDSSQRKFYFAVALIPHTLSVTTLGDLQVGDSVNIEADLIGKYVNRLMCGWDEKINKGGLSMNFLSEHGYT